MMLVKGYLVVRADGSMRVTKRRALRTDEVAFALSVSIPSTWGRVHAPTIDVVLPEPPESTVTMGEPELAE